MCNIDVKKTMLYLQLYQEHTYSQQSDVTMVNRKQINLDAFVNGCDFHNAIKAALTH